MSDQLDLQQLSSAASNRENKTRGSVQPPRRLVSRYVLPALILFGFLGMVGWATRDQFIHRQEVSVVPVVVTRAEAQIAGTPLFQAAGWVEPRPSRRLATALTPGIVQEVFVVEGENVESGQELAQLLDADAKLELQQALADLALRNAELETTRSQTIAAQQRLDSPMKRQAEFAEAKSKQVDAELELSRLPFEIKAMQSRLKYAEQSFQYRKDAGNAVATTLTRESESEMNSLQAQLDNLNNQAPLLQKRIDALREKADALKVEREKLIDERRSVSLANAEVSVAEARIQQAQLVVEIAELRLSRMVIKAPVSGRVLEVMAFPGSAVMGQSPQSNPEVSAVVSLYDPDQLQIRADVRLEDVPLLEPGQPVLIETASSSEPIEGYVLQGTSRANIQKNTLEAKVAIKSPPVSIRPEMLVRATFLAAEREDTQTSNNSEQERLLIPRRLIEQKDDETSVWIVTAEGTAHRQPVTLGRASTETLVEVTDGLHPTDKLISTGRESIEEGDRRNDSD